MCVKREEGREEERESVEQWQRQLARVDVAQLAETGRQSKRYAKIIPI